MTDPYVCHINGVPFTINETPSHVSIFLPYMDPIGNDILYNVGNKKQEHTIHLGMVTIPCLYHLFMVKNLGWCLLWFYHVLPTFY